MDLKGKRLGTIFKELALIDADQEKAALEYAQQWGIPFGRACVKMGFVDEELVVRALAVQAGAPSVSLAGIEVPAETIALIPKKYAEKHRVVPISVFQAAGRARPTLVLAASSHRDVGALDELAQVTGHRVSIVIASDKDVGDALYRYYAIDLERHIRSKQMVDFEQDSSMDAQVSADPLEFLPTIDIGKTNSSRR